MKRCTKPDRRGKRNLFHIIILINLYPINLEIIQCLHKLNPVLNILCTNYIEKLEVFQINCSFWQQVLLLIYHYWKIGIWAAVLNFFLQILKHNVLLLFVFCYTWIPFAPFYFHLFSRWSKILIIGFILIILMKFTKWWRGGKRHIIHTNLVITTDFLFCILHSSVCMYLMHFFWDHCLVSLVSKRLFK